MDAVELARAYVAERFPAATFAVLGGSAGSGTAGPSSDLDVLVLVEDPEADGVATTRFRGRLVEAFVYSPTALDRWLIREVESRRPVLLDFLANGVVLLDDGPGAALRARAAEGLERGPGPLSPQDRDARRYHLSALLDDLRDAPPGGQQEYVILAGVFQAAAELLLLAHGGWIGMDKWLPRRLAQSRHPLAAELLDWAAGARDASSLLQLGTAVLDACGGYLQAGFVRGTIGG